VNQAIRFHVVLEPQPEGGFTVTVPALPEVVTEGDTEAEALQMAQDAIRLVLEDMVAHGEKLPDPTAPQLREVSVTLAA
jgi:antitoxin HicB